MVALSGQCLGSRLLPLEPIFKHLRDEMKGRGRKNREGENKTSTLLFWNILIREEEEEKNTFVPVYHRSSHIYTFITREGWIYEMMSELLYPFFVFFIFVRPCFSSLFSHLFSNSRRLLSGHERRKENKSNPWQRADGNVGIPALAGVWRAKRRRQ